ncbi:hypothetical protein IWQ51_001713 [Labrenzia sp. EL_142]|nr:hypothetical protein [Labrenzia sp. EL_142]
MDLFKPNSLELAKAVARLDQAIRETGISDIRVNNEVSELELAADQAGKTNGVGEHFRRSLNTLPPNQVLWIGLFDDENKCVTTCACKYENCTGWSLQHLIRQYFERTFRTEDGEYVKLTSGSTSFVSTAKGAFVYVGEGHVQKKWRSKNLLALAQRLLILAAYMRWEPDLIYGFMRPDKIRDRYHLNWGYTVARPNALIWEKSPAEPSLHDLYFVGLASEGVCRLAANPLLIGHSTHRASSTLEKPPLDQSRKGESGADSEVAEELHRLSVGR